MRELKSQGTRRPSDIAKALKIGRASAYRVLGQKADHRGPAVMLGNDLGPFLL
jgi:hypothetical protein